MAEEISGAGVMGEDPPLSLENRIHAPPVKDEEIKALGINIELTILIPMCLWRASPP